MRLDRAAEPELSEANAREATQRAPLEPSDVAVGRSCRDCVRVCVWRVQRDEEVKRTVVLSPVYSR